MVLTQTLKPLPDDVMMTMKLFYYDDGKISISHHSSVCVCVCTCTIISNPVTPEDYEPPGFKPTPADEEIEFKDEPVTIKVGDVSTVIIAWVYIILLHVLFLFHRLSIRELSYRAR